MQAKARTKAWYYLRVAISVTLLAILVSYTDINEMWEIGRNARLDLLFLTGVLAIADRFLAAYRWYVLLRGRSWKVTFGGVVRLTFVSGFLGFFIPGTIGSEVVRIYSMARTSESLALSFSSVLVERILAGFALIILVTIGLIFSPVTFPQWITWTAGFAVAVLSIVIVALMHPRFRRSFDHLLPSRYRLPIRSRLANFYACLDAYKEQPQRMVWVTALSIGVELLRIARTVVTAWALGLQFPVIVFIFIMPIIIFIVQLPIHIAGLGVREAAFIYLFGQVGMSAAAALSLSLISFAVAIIATILPGAWLYASGRQDRGKLTGL